MAIKTYIIGRAGDIKLYDDTVSRRHASLEIADGALVLRDLRSRNGTYEIRDKQLVPFSGGAIARDQVFAFGECVRSVAQLLQAVADADRTAVGEPPGGSTEPPRRADETLADVEFSPRPRLSTADILSLLNEIEEACAGGEPLDEVLTRLNISEERYARWSKHQGAVRDDNTVNTLRRENERLRRLVADLVLERDALKEALVKLNVPQRPDGASLPNISLISDK
ncbi:MAG: FHA domain-containing protein, partial [Gammaproteobacteria bacterium]